MKFFVFYESTNFKVWDVITGVAAHRKLKFWLFFVVVVFCCCCCCYFMTPFCGWGSIVSRLQSHYKESDYFLPLSPQKFMVIIWLAFLWMGFNCLNTTEPLQGDGLLYTTKSPEILDTHLINHGKMKGWVDLGAP